MSQMHDIRSGRLSPERYLKNFSDLHPPFDLTKAAIEANRCLFCYDAPCIEACPTEINIPGFIRKIATGNLKGSAVEILSENIMGGTCARVCPVETLCQKACVRNTAEGRPVAIGLLQRYATDWLFRKGFQPFVRSPSTGKRIAIVGAGPASLSCAHGLAKMGHEITVYEAKEKAGGLNEFGLAAYKVVDEFVQREIEFILSIGGMTIQYGRAMGKNLSLSELRKEYDAVFLGFGLSGVNALGLQDENMPGVWDAVPYIEKIRQANGLGEIPVGRRIVVIGGGNTAIDIAVQTKLLGAEEVTLVYRRGKEKMGATGYEQQMAQTRGVTIRYHAKPIRLLGDERGVMGVEFARTDSGGGQVGSDGPNFILPADMVFKAIGQIFVPSALGQGKELLEMASGKLLVDEKFETTLPEVFAGGDCVCVGEDLTVTAVQHGKLAAQSIHSRLMGEEHV